MRKVIVPIVLVVALMPPFAGRALAQPAPQCSTHLLPFIYSVKFLCGLQLVPSDPGTVPSEPPVKPGNYATAVNVHNYHSDLQASICKKAVIALPESSRTKGEISQFTTDILTPNQAAEVDCSDIATLLQTPGTTLSPFIKGFVEILSPVPLSVTAVYTSQGCSSPSLTATTPAKCPKLGELALEVVPQQALPGP